MRPNAPPAVAALFLRRKLGSLYLARWNEVCRFCGRLKDLLPYLRGLWDERAFMSDVQEKDAATFKPADVTAVLADSLFMAYFDMVLGLATTLEQLGSWCESCPCHEDLIRTVEAPGHAVSSRKRKRYTSMSKLFGCKVGDGSDSFTCPMRGKRFPELVAYGMQKVLDANHQNAYMHLLISHRKFLSPEQWCVLVSDFEQGKHSIELEMSIKLDYTQRLPYKLAVLGLADVSCARRKMLEIVEFWDGQSDFLHKQHHPLSQRILSHDSVARIEVDRFIEGEALCNLPSLDHLAGCFRLVQVSERYLEASHSILKRKVAPNSAGPVISLSRRLWRLAMDIDIDPNTLMQVADLYEVARDIKSLPARLGLAGHPDLVVTGNKKKWGVVKVMNRILYRCDVPGQYLDVSEPRKFDDSYQNNRKKLRQAIADRVRNRGEVRVGYEAIRLSALRQHMLALSEDNAEGIFCLQVPYRSVPGVLQDLPTAMRTMKVSTPQISLLPDMQQAGPAQDFDNEYAESYAATEDGGNPNPVVQIFFRIVHTKPSSRRTISLAPGAGIGSRLHPQDVAVHICETVSQPGRELQTWLDCCPKAGQLSQVSVLRDLAKWFSFEELSDCLLWGTFSKAHESMYQLDKHSIAESSVSVPPDSVLLSLQCDQVLTRLVSAEALRIPVDDVPIADIVIFDKLLEANFVSKSDSFFEATTVLLSYLKLVRQMEPLKSVAASFETIEPTTHQLLQQLEEQGFQWKQLEQKEMLIYEVGKKRTWGTRGQEVFPEMLQCLLSASDLEKQFGIKQIPFGRSRRVYVDLLQGVLPPVVQNMPQLLPDVAVAPRQRKKCAPIALMDLGADVDGHIDSMAINSDYDDDDDDYNANAVHERSSIACVDSIHDVDVGQEEQISRLLELVGEPEANHDETAVLNAVSHRASSSRPHAEDAASAPADSVQPEAMKAPLPVDVAAPANPGPDPSPGQPNVSNFSWGAFRFTFKKTGKQMAVQATCPFHARNNSTGCKKSLNINPFTQARLDEQVLLLKHWCNQATKFRLQRDHLNCPLQPGSVPDSSVVEAQCIPRASKPEDVITDVDQDAAANATQNRPKAKAKSKSVAIKKQKARPKGAVAEAASSTNQLPGKNPKMTHLQVPAATLPVVAVIAATAASQEAPVLDSEHWALRENVGISCLFATYCEKC